MSYEKKQLQEIIEGAILAAGEPLTLDRMLSLFEEHEAPSKELLKEVVDDLKQSCDGRGFVLTEVASGYRFQVREDLATWVNRLWEEKPQKYSRAMLETLALIAYRQPITRGDIEEVRGVAVSSHIIKTLAEREWVKVVGHRDVPGRPALYATTKLFLDYFNLKSLDELPTLGELRDIDSLNESLEFDSLPPEVQESITAAAQAAQAAESADSQGEQVGENASAEAAGSEAEQNIDIAGDREGSLFPEGAEPEPVVDTENTEESEAGEPNSEDVISDEPVPDTGEAHTELAGDEEHTPEQPITSEGSIFADADEANYAESDNTQPNDNKAGSDEAQIETIAAPQADSEPVSEPEAENLTEGKEERSHD